MSLKYKCPECGTPLGFEGLCWRCRKRKHREEVNSWTEDEIQKKNKPSNRKIKNFNRR